MRLEVFLSGNKQKNQLSKGTGYERKSTRPDCSEWQLMLYLYFLAARFKINILLIIQCKCRKFCVKDQLLQDLILLQQDYSVLGLELPAKLLDYFLRSNKGNINQIFLIPVG